jgi:hypothetical protein
VCAHCPVPPSSTTFECSTPGKSIIGTLYYYLRTCFHQTTLHINQVFCSYSFTLCRANQWVKHLNTSTQPNDRKQYYRAQSQLLNKSC